jgi:hypothetical protein
MPVPIEFKKTLAAFAERNSQTKTYTGEVITAPDVDGKCKVRVSGGTAQTCLANGLVEQGKTYPVVRFPGSVYLIVVGGASEGAVVAQEQSGLPLTLTSDLVAHALDGEFHTGSIRDDQAPQFALLNGSRDFMGEIRVNEALVHTTQNGGEDSQFDADKLDGRHADDFALVTAIPQPYVHVQSTPASVWYIAHHLVRFPSITVIDSANDTVIGNVTYIDSNSLEVKFSGAFSGQAYLI